MSEKFRELLESGEHFEFNKVKYSNPKVKEELKKVVERQERIIKESECTIYEMSRIYSPQFHPFYGK